MKKQEKFYQKYAWLIFVFIGLLIITGGIPHMLGLNTDPALVEHISGHTLESLEDNYKLHFNLYDFYFRSGGLSDIGVGYFIIIISFLAYRKREKWAWFALGFVPLFFASYILVSLSLPSKAQMVMLPPLIVFTAISVLGLVAPYRLFFKKDSQ